VTMRSDQKIRAQYQDGEATSLEAERDAMRCRAESAESDWQSAEAEIVRLRDENERLRSESAAREEQRARLVADWREMVKNANAEGPSPHDEIGHAARWTAVEMCADELALTDSEQTEREKFWNFVDKTAAEVNAELSGDGSSGPFADWMEGTYQAIAKSPCIHTLETGKHEPLGLHWVHQANAPFSYPQCPTCGWIDLELMMKDAGLVRVSDQPGATPVTERETFTREHLAELKDIARLLRSVLDVGYSQVAILASHAPAVEAAVAHLEADRREGTGEGEKHLRNATDSVGWLDTTGPTSRVPRPDSGPRETGSSNVKAAPPSDSASMLAQAHRAIDGDDTWIEPDPQSGWIHGCCECGLAHRVEMRIEGGKVAFRFKQDAEATRILRASGDGSSGPDLQLVREKIQWAIESLGVLTHRDARGALNAALAALAPEPTKEPR